MNSRFSLADLLIVLGMLGFAFICFLSFNFLSLGDIEASIIRAVIFALLLGVSAFGAKLLKITDRPAKAKVIWEGILLLLFAIIAIRMIFPFSHVFTVYDRKEDIQGKLKIELATDMFDNYEKYVQKRLDKYRDDLETAVYGNKTNKEYKEKYGFEDSINMDYNSQIEKKMEIMKEQLLETNVEQKIDYIAEKKNAFDWFLDAKNKIDNWMFISIGVAKIISDVNNETTYWKDKLIKISTYRAKGETANDFYSPLAFDDETSKITTQDNPTPFSILCAIGLYMLMLLSYFITKRHTRWPGFKMIFGTGKTTDKEL